MRIPWAASIIYSVIQPSAAQRLQLKAIVVMNDEAIVRHRFAFQEEKQHFRIALVFEIQNGDFAEKVAGINFDGGMKRFQPVSHRHSLVFAGAGNPQAPENRALPSILLSSAAHRSLEYPAQPNSRYKP